MASGQFGVQDGRKKGGIAGLPGKRGREKAESRRQNEESSGQKAEANRPWRKLGTRQEEETGGQPAGGGARAVNSRGACLQSPMISLAWRNRSGPTGG